MANMANRSTSLEDLPELVDSQNDSSRSTPDPDPVPIPASPLLKGRKRLLSGLKRMGSSQSLLRLHRPSSHAYRGIGAGASVSCISLSSTSASPSANAWPSSEGSPSLSNGFSTAPTSIPGTPGRETEPNVRMRSSARGVSAGNASQIFTPSAVPFPSIQEARDLARPSTATGLLQRSTHDYFSLPVSALPTRTSRPDLDFWGDMPPELRFYILQMLPPKQIIRSSAVCKSWYDMCFDGQLWAHLNTAAYYRDIPAEALVKIIAKAGPFARDLNLRGCVQLDAARWNAGNLSEACTNLENLSLEGCTMVHRHSIHNLLHSNSRLVHIDVSGLSSVTNTTLKIISQNCPSLELLNISWCTNMDARGLKKVVQRCPRLRDLRASEIRGLHDLDFMVELFSRNSLERLVLSSCESLADESLKALIQGIDSELDLLTGRRLVPARRLKHLDLSRSKNITNDSVSTFAHNLPHLEGLRLSKCPGISDASLLDILPTLPRLTHLDLEELEHITNASLQQLAASPCAATLKHLSISYCESLGDTGMLPVLKACPHLRNLELDNTRISNLVLIEAAATLHTRPAPARTASVVAATATATAATKPLVALRMVVYDCQNVTWSGIQEVLARNAEPARPVIALKVFYGYQPTVAEHTRRVLRGDRPAAARLAAKWGEYMMASEEAGAPGGFGFGGVAVLAGRGWAERRRRRRAREAMMMHADEEGGEGAGAGDGVGRRRRARSGGGAGCAVM